MPFMTLNNGLKREDVKDQEERLKSTHKVDHLTSIIDKFENTLKQKKNQCKTVKQWWSYAMGSKSINVVHFP